MDEFRQRLSLIADRAVKQLHMTGMAKSRDDLQIVGEACGKFREQLSQLGMKYGETEFQKMIAIVRRFVSSVENYALRRSAKLD